MLDDASSRTPGSPEWWLLRLGKRLADEAPRFDRLEAYWRGCPPVPHGNKRMRDAYRRLQRMARTNFGALIAEAVLERTKVIGFSAGGDETDKVDKDFWKNSWQANHLDADQGLVHRAAVVLSRSYVIVGDDPNKKDKTLVTGEDPRQVIHESKPGNRREVAAALKSWWDDIEGAQLAVLYLPDQTYYYRTEGIRGDHQLTAAELWSPARWIPDTGQYSEGSIPNSLGEVPVVPFINRPDMAGEGLGEFEDVIDILDRINTSILDRLVISAMQAYRQRWAKGVKLTDEDGNDNTAFDPGADLLWAVEAENAQFGEFSVTDLTGLIKAIESDVQYLSAITRTPPHYVLAGIVNASGDALSVAETGLTSKVLERQAEFGEAWETVYRLVGKRESRKTADDCEVKWRDPQFRSLNEMASASVQLKAADVPWRTRMRLLDMTPQQIDRMEAERMQDVMTAMLMMTTLGVAPGGAPGMPGQTTQTGFPTGVPLGIPGGKQGSLDETSSPLHKGSRNSGSINRNSGGRTDGGGTGSTGIGGNVTWDQLYSRARGMGIRGASRMSKAQLQQAVGGG